MLAPPLVKTPTVPSVKLTVNVEPGRFVRDVLVQWFRNAVQEQSVTLLQPPKQLLWNADVRTYFIIVKVSWKFLTEFM